MKDPEILSHEFWTWLPLNKWILSKMFSSRFLQGPTLSQWYEKHSFIVLMLLICKCHRWCSYEISVGVSVLLLFSCHIVARHINSVTGMITYVSTKAQFQTESSKYHGYSCYRPPLWSSGQGFWLQIQRSRVRFPALPDCLSGSGSGTGCTQPREPHEVNWGATWIK